MARPEVELLEGAVHLADSVLWFDSPRRREFSFLSHAHGGTLARDSRIIATATTVRLMAQRLGPLPNGLTAPYFHSFDLGPLRLQLHPAGRMFGSAQLLVVRNGVRIAYAGEFSLRSSLTAEAAAVVSCDVLILAAAFGHPRFRLPPGADGGLARIEAFVRRSLAQGDTPVLLADSLGKSPEILRFLGDQGIQLRVDESICAVAKVYRESGCGLPPTPSFRGEVRPGEVLIVPPHRARGAGVRRLPRRHTAAVTDWVIERDPPAGHGADEVIPLSNHADFDQLLHYAEASGARQIYTVHGFSEVLAGELRLRGHRAQPLTTRDQLELFG